MLAAVLTGCCILASTAGAQTTGCLAELDYLLGEWQAEIEYFRPDGRLVRRARATATVRAILDGTAIETLSTTTFDGEDPVKGRSTLHATTTAGNYVLLAANSSGSSNLYRGSTEAGGLRLVAEHRDERGRTTLYRRVDRRIDGGRFEIQLHVSHDDGETWMLHMRQLNERRRPSQQFTSCTGGEAPCPRVPSYPIPIGPDRFRLRIPETPVSSLGPDPVFVR